jgi:ATP-dependent Clp protease ATP-binding subunit ClpC
MNRLSRNAQHCFSEAERIALYHKSASLKPEHLFLAIFFKKGSAGSITLAEAGFHEEIFKPLFTKNLSSNSPSPILQKSEIPLSSEVKQSLLSAYKLAYLSKSPYVGTEHLAKSLLVAIPPLFQSRLNQRKNQRKTLPKKTNKISSSPFLKISRFPFQNIQDDSDERSSLEEFSTNMHERVLQGKDLPLIGRDHLLKKMATILTRKTKSNVLLLGDPGVGKTALVSGLAKAISQGRIPKLENAIIYELDLALLVSGTSFRGEFEARLKDIIYEASENPNIILFIDELHTIVGTGNISGSLDAANILKPALARGDIRCVGATTFSEYKKHIEKDSALERRFQCITVTEPDHKEAFEILCGVRKEFEKHHHVFIPEDTLAFAIETSSRYLPEKRLPDKVIDLLDEASSTKRIHIRKTASIKQNKTLQSLEKIIEDTKAHRDHCIEQEEYEKALALNTQILDLKKKLASQQASLVAKKSPKTPPIPLYPQDIARILSEYTSIPEEKILSQKTKTVLTLSQNLKRSVIGQDQVTKTLAKTLKRSFSGLGDERRPLGSFLFLGPSGVGKTHTAKILAQSLFERKDSFIRVDMSEFREHHQISGLIGAPAGYVGYGEGGKFTERVRKNPHSVILFDEIEKAHPDVLNILLQILEEGSLTDGEGKSISLRESVIILTSNIGSSLIQEHTQKPFGFQQKAETGISYEALEEKIKKELYTTLRPELVDRLDMISVFRPLSKKHIQSITTLFLKTLKERIQTNKNITLSWERNVPLFLSQKAYQPHTGARHVRRVLQEYVEDALAEYLLTHAQPPALTISLQENTLIISPSKS